jgi:hypothetical protein
MRETWIVEPDAGAECEPPVDGDPPLLFLGSGRSWLILMPPTTRDDLPTFCRFLQDLAAAADELRLVCQPTGEWGRQAFAPVVGGEGDGLADAGTRSVAQGSC